MATAHPARVLAIALLLLVLPLTACEPLGPEELQREIESIGSFAAEGSVLADQVAAKRTMRTFARVQARELGDQAEHSAERLTDAQPATGLDPATDRAIALAAQVSDQLGEIEIAPEDAAEAQRAAERLRDLSDEAARLASSL